ncbi:MULTISPECIES: CHAT domain-containing protein [Roseobacteraceae]|nr:MULTISPECIES: CHAT domain-containing protein [Roseobacteraceae]
MQQADANCPYREADTDACVVFFHRAALGGVAADLSAPAYAWLRARAALEWDEIERSGLKAHVGNEGTDIVWRNPLATIALSDVLIFYGDYAQATQIIERLTSIDLLNVDVDGLQTISADGLRRQIVRYREGRAADDRQKDELENLLSALASRGDTVARDFLETLRTPIGGPATVVNPGDLQARFERAEAHPASRALSNTARQLASLKFAEGDGEAAVEYEQIAMNADMVRHATAGIQGGPLVADMARVCSLSRTSEQLFAFGAPEIALTLAKDAVNRLQGIRAVLSDLPEDLQMCFQQKVAGHYRWLADLFIVQNRPAEASRVLDMLKDFETFQFSERAPDQAGDSFETLHLAPQETRLLDAVATRRTTIAQQSRKYRALAQIAATRDLTAQEQASFQMLEAELAEAATLREQTRAFLQETAAAVGRADVGVQLAPGKSIKRYLRQKRQDEAAVLQYLVLPDRMGLVLTTAASQSVWTWDTTDGAQFSETDLNEQIAQFRTVLQTPSSDAVPLAQRLHDLLLPNAVVRELEGSGIQTLIIAPDRQLRYIPFAALHDGTGWLAERFVVTHATAGGIVATSDAGDRISAFGLSNPVGDFPALPGVATEVAALVQENGSDSGVLRGQGRMNDDFDATAFARGLVFSDAQNERLGIVHLASHFKLGNTEADSFLLLGDGNRLSVADIRTGLGRDSDFSEVALLTLSACETAFGTTSADGRELESFAAVAQRQGAQAVLASLWPVADASTAAIMVNFYQRYTSNTPLAHALSQSQNDLISGEVNSTRPEAVRGAAPSIPVQTQASPQGWRHPYYWAAFILLEGAV